MGTSRKLGYYRNAFSSMDSLPRPDKQHEKQGGKCFCVGLFRKVFLLHLFMTQEESASPGLLTGWGRSALGVELPVFLCSCLQFRLPVLLLADEYLGSLSASEIKARA